MSSYVVGDPGRAAGRVVAAPDVSQWHQPDTVLDGVTVPGPAGSPAVHVRAASVRGLSHRHYGRVRQDEYAFRLDDRARYLVACVADGVSSGSRSHLAAGWAARRGTDLLCERLTCEEPSGIAWGDFVREVADLITRSGRAYLGGCGIEGWEDFGPWEVAEHLATTATYAVVDLAASPEALPVHVFGVGDSSAWLLAGGRWRPLQAVKNMGETIYSSVVTALPTMPPVLPEAVRTTVAAGEALVLMSDGVGDPLDDGTGEVGEFLAARWRTPPADLDFAAQVSFQRRSYDDDRTALALWPVTAEVPVAGG